MGEDTPRRWVGVVTVDELDLRALGRLVLSNRFSVLS
jgi:hypothetical protein